MAKLARKNSTQLPAPNSGEGFTSFSIRLNDQQRDLVGQAAKLKGWTPTQLVRTATLERAVAICNTAVPRTFDYKGLASTLAARLFGSRKVNYSLSAVDSDRINDENGDGELEVPVLPLSIDDFYRLKKAAGEGGTEFLGLLVEFAEGLTASQRIDLPAPIDPRAYLGRED